MGDNIIYQLEDIARYLGGLKDQKKAREDELTRLRSQRTLLNKQIEDLQKQLESLDRNIRQEELANSRLATTIDTASATYAKLIESSQSLIDYVRKEYEESRSSSRSSYTS